MNHKASLINLLLISSISYFILESLIYGLALNFFDEDISKTTKFFLRVIQLSALSLILYLSAYSVNRKAFLISIFFIVIGFFLSPYESIFLPIYNSLIFIIIVLIVFNHHNLTLGVILFWAFLNALLLVFTVLWKIDITHSYQLYTENLNDLYLRPVGIFSNTIYLTVFQFLVNFLIIANNPRGVYKYFIVFSFPFIGSFSTIVVSAILLSYTFKTKNGFWLSMSLLMGFLCNYLFNYDVFLINYTLEQFVQSVSLRLNSGHENNLFQVLLSMYKINFSFVELTVFICLGLVVLIMPFALKLKIFTLTIFGPLLLHPILLHPFFAFILSFVLFKIINQFGFSFPGRNQ